ncbi:hypothetical protein CEN49_25185 [Fischerella thermalis CCMEE 5273]|uniref:Uncharacterized protein n=1 Tax=Chlorogloeopsis fritschii PCC 6912 TaxID=211165 RepID=A0A3S0XYA6_CHLFR|nr:hypothetical protein [Chlorogloeopsis fritschii]PMB02611.1 hypothetical protein CEN49_25185 [Fischerella thermalis CCMEE 5273]PMB50500.1 hypothetical protein CEN40_01810 [Fischerella thermalis CCMEE 5205]RUR83779.1 hypothetical protein PCC6912_20220 [Chlorogloeopsis fritschii PCC 6912]
MAEQKSPPSEMIRVPVPLIGVVRRLSKLHRQGHTIALLQALEELLGEFDSKNDIDVTAGSKSVKQLEQKLLKLESHLADQGSSMETKLEAITKKLELIERAIASGRLGNNKGRRQAYPYQQSPVELQPRTNESLARRLGVSPQGLAAERENNSAKEFLSWSRNRDPMSVAWEWNASDGLYHPQR